MQASIRERKVVSIITGKDIGLEEVPPRTSQTEVNESEPMVGDLSVPSQDHKPPFSEVLGEYERDLSFLSHLDPKSIRTILRSPRKLIKQDIVNLLSGVPNHGKVASDGT